MVKADIPMIAILQTAEEFGINDKVVKAYELIDELEPLLAELREYGFDSPEYIHLAPLGHTSSDRGEEYVDKAHNLIGELASKRTEDGDIVLTDSMRRTRSKYKSFFKR